MDRLYAAWRLGNPKGVASDGLPHADLEPEPGKTLFETIEQSALADEQTYILKRSQLCFALMNVFPYTPGHSMVLPKRAVTTLDELTNEEYAEVWQLVREATSAVKATFKPDGLNVGVNEGTAGGGSIPDHLHVHIVPRWSADTNFITTISDARILPITLGDAWQRLQANWPS